MPLLHALVMKVLPYVPRPLMRRMAAPYIAGEALHDALARLEALRAAGHPGIIDVLGEEVRDEARAREVARGYREAADAIAERGLDAYVSVKPTHVGLRLAEPLALELYRDLARHCGSRGLFLRVEMEDHTTTDATLRLFEALRRDHPNVGVVLQSRLLRTPADIARLAPGPLDVRMVKGIYLEPPTIAHVDPEPIRAAFVECSRLLLARGAHVSFATHDAAMAERLFALVREQHVPPERWELQVLLGVQTQLWERWKAQGHTVRVYVPYGPEWLPYSLRRLKKNPQVLGHVMRAALRL